MPRFDRDPRRRLIWLTAIVVAFGVVVYFGGSALQGTVSGGDDDSSVGG